jgi:PAS domain S-box-containing protein
MNDFQVGTSPLAHNPLLFAHTLVQALEEGVATLDGNDQLTFCNQAFGQLLGRPVSSLVGQSLRDLFPEGLPPAERVDAGYGREHGGARGPFSVRVVPVASPGDQPPGARLVILKPAPPPGAYDAPGRSAGEEIAAGLAHPLLEKITGVLPGVVTVYNAHTGRYAYVSQGVTALLGYEPDQLRAGGLSFLHEMIHPQDREAVQRHHDAWRHQAETDRPAEPFECRVRHRDGAWKWLRSTGVPLDGDPGGVVLHVAEGWQDVTESREAASTLRRQADLLANAQSVASFGLWEYHVADGRIDWSDEMYHIFGYRPGEVTVDLALYANVLHPDDRDRFREEVTATLRDRQPSVSEQRIYRPDGTLRHLVSRTDVAKDDAGNVLKVTGLTMDVTELQHTRSALHEKQRLIGRITETTPDILYIYDLKARRNVYANRRLSEVLGFPVEDIRAMRDRFLAVFTHADDYPRLLDAMERLALAADHDVVEVEYRIMDPQGHWHWFYDRATIFTRDPDGSVREVLGSSQDITERKLAQEKLTESEYFIKQVADATPDGLYVYDLQLGRSVYNNRQIYQMLGYSYEAFHALGTSTTQTITHPDDLPRRQAHFARLAQLADGEVADLEYRVRTTGGAWLWVHSRDSVFKRTAAGAPWQVLGIVQDVTERKKGVQELAYKDHLIGQMLANFPLVLTRMDRTGTILECTGSGLRDLGIRDNELQGANVFSLYPRMAPYLREVMNGSKVTFLYDVEVDGERKYFQNYYFYDPGLACAVGFSIDITERKEAEEQLAESRLFIEQITQAVPQIIYVFDLIEGRNLYINREVYTSVGYSQEQIAGMGNRVLDAITHPDEREMLAAHFGRVGAEPGKVHELEYRIRDAAGHWRWFYCRDTLFKRTPDGQPWQVLGSTQDITDRRAAEEELRDKNEIIQGILSNLPVILTRIDADGVIRESVGAGLRRIGRSDGEIVGANVFTDGRYGSVAGYLRDVLRGYSVTFVGSPVYRDKSFYFLNYYYYDAAQRMAVGFSLDITAQHETEQKLKRSEEQLRELNAGLERRVAERTAALAASEERYRIFVQQSSEAIWRFELQGISSIDPALSEDEQLDLIYRHVYLAECNDTMARMYGYDTADEIIGAPLAQMLPRTEPANVQYLRSFIRSGYRLADAESVEPDREGNVKYFLNNLLGIAEDGRLVRAWGIQRDITDRKRAEEALREKEQEYRSLVTATSQMIWFTSPEGLITEDIPLWRRYTGQRREEVTGYGWTDALHPDDKVRTDYTWRRAVERSQVYEAEYRLRSKYGEYRWFFARGVPIFDRNGNVKKWIGACNDIHDHKLAEEALRRSEKRFRVALENSPVTVFECDADLRYTWVYNPRFGSSAEGLLGKRDDEIAPPAVAEKMLDYKRQALALGRSGRFNLHVSHDGQHYYYDIVTEPLHDATGTVAGLTVASIDVTPQRRVEEALRTSEERLEMAVRAAGIGIFDWRFPEDHVIWTEQEERLFGLAPGTFGGTTSAWAGYVLPEDLPEVQRQLEEHLARRDPELPMQYRIRRADGAVRWIEGAGKFIYAEDGTPLRAVGINMDITERKLADQALRQSESRFRRLFESDLVGIIFSDREGVITDANNAFLALVGYNRDDLAARRLRWKDLTPPEYAASDAEAMRQMMEKGGAVPYEKEFFRKDGSRVAILIGASLLKETTPASAVGFVLDISDRKAARERLHLSEERFRLVAEATNEGIWDWDIRADQVWRNEGYAKLFGYPPGQTNANLDGWQRRLHPQDTARVRRGVEEALHGDKDNWADEYRIQKMDGSYAYVMDRAYILRDGQGRPVRMIGSKIDLTALKETQLALEQQAIELKQSNADLEQFAYISSHDLQEPLNTAASFAKLLKRRYESRLDGDANDFIDFVVDATDRMKKIIRSLLEYSRISSVGKEADAVPLENVLGEVRKNLQPRLEETGADLRVGPMPTVRANEIQLLQLFQNLVGNALKFRSAAPPVITVEAEEEPGHWRFKVADNGIGMDMKYAGEKIFQVFQRLHSREEYEGTGIGLAICKKIVERHGGTIWAESQPGSGSVFYFTLKK